MNADLPQAAAEDAPADPAYSYKPSLMGAPYLFHLRAGGLEWSRGRHSSVIPYRDITRLRLSYRPVTMQSARYQLDIWMGSILALPLVSSSWRSMVEVKSQNAEFRAFVLELHKRIAQAGGTPRCDTGTFAPLYWFGFAVFAATSLGIAALIVRALQSGQWTGGLFIAAFLALFLWQAGQFFRRNRPGTYPLDAPPALLLPAA